MKILKMVIVFLICFSSVCYASEIDKNQFGVSNFLRKSEKYTRELNINISDIFDKIIKGKFDNKEFLKIIKRIVSQNSKDALKTLSEIVLIILINSILRAICENLGNDSVSKIANYVQYLLLITILMKNFSEIITEIKESIENLTAFSNSLIPLLTTLIIATGKVTTSGVIEPILLVMVTFIGNFEKNILIPFILVGTVLGIVSKISPNIQLDRISKYMKKSSVWIISIVMTLFISVAALEGGLTSNIDDVAKKTGKSVISAAVPVVGGVIGDALETITGYSNLLKNAVGTIGIITIICICLKPIIKLAIYTILYYISVALVEIIADKNITEIMEQMAETFKIMLSIFFMMTVMLIIGLAVVMKITG